MATAAGTLRPPPSAEDEAEEAARAAGLRYVYDTEPGFGRTRRGNGFAYTTQDGKPLRDETHVARIKALAIPPAWTDVWICPSARGHIQATGRDARGRKQYRYHARWRAVRDENKFDRLIAFGQALPKIRRAVERDLKRDGLPRERVIAAVVSLLDRTFLRVGNDEYARANGSFGLTTLRDKHVEVRGSTIRFEFKGKSGKLVKVDVEHPRCARVVRRCRDLPGYRIFQYEDESGEHRNIESGDVNDYLRELTGSDISAKDFRTWAGTVLFARAAKEAGEGRSARDATRRLNAAVSAVASMLGNTAAVCRACYIHPALIEAHADEKFTSLWDLCENARAPRLRQDEAIVLAMLKKIRRASTRKPANGTTKAA